MVSKFCSRSQGQPPGSTGEARYNFDQTRETGACRLPLFIGHAFRHGKSQIITRVRSGCGWKDTRAVRIVIFDRLAAGCLRKQPAGGEGTGGWGLRKVSESTFNRALPGSYAVTSRHFRDVRINQRIDSLPCPALSSMFPGRLARLARERSFERPRVPRTRINQTTTISLRRLELRLDYAGGGGEGVRPQSAKSLSSAEIEVREGA